MVVGWSIFEVGLVNALDKGVSKYRSTLTQHVTRPSGGRVACGSVKTVAYHGFESQPAPYIVVGDSLNYGTQKDATFDL